MARKNNNNENISDVEYGFDTDNFEMQERSEEFSLEESTTEIQSRESLSENDKILEVSDEIVEELAENIVEKEDIAHESDSDKASTQPARRSRRKTVTIDNSGQQTVQLSPEDISWHEVQSAFRTRRILTGILSGIEQLENDSYIAVVYYKEIRVVIPITEMLMTLSGTEQESSTEIAVRQSKIINSMLGCDIDFIVRGIDSRSRSAVASRKEAMIRKRNQFYNTTDINGEPMITVGSIAEARIIAVTDKVVRAEIFGVECSIPPRELSWDWMGNAKERFDIGDHVSVKIQQIERTGGVESIKVQASIKEAVENTVLANLKKCKVQGKYAGKVTDIIRGNVHIRLSIGVNAIAQSCNDPRLPGKNDDISFVVTRIDENRGLALGIITRIIRQNI